MIVITGASDGLGLQISKLYKENGKYVVNLSRSKCEFADENIECDLTNPKSITNASNLLNESSESIEVLINCAGVMSIQKLGSITPEEIQKTFATNIMGAIQLTSELSPKLVKDTSDIVNVASTVGTKAYEDQAVYGSSKWAMRGFSQNLQIELKKSNVRVISLCVGGFNSDIAKKATGKGIPDPENWMNPRDIAQFVKQILDLPKNMEVSEIIINRKSG